MFELLRYERIRNIRGFLTRRERVKNFPKSTLNYVGVTLNSKLSEYICSQILVIELEQYYIRTRQQNENVFVQWTEEKKKCWPLSIPVWIIRYTYLSRELNLKYLVYLHALAKLRETTIVKRFSENCRHRPRAKSERDWEQV